MSNPTAPIAWDGTSENFWDAVEKIRQNKDIESDHAVLCDVLAQATRHVVRCCPPLEECDETE